MSTSTSKFISNVQGESTNPEETLIYFLFAFDRRFGPRIEWIEQQFEHAGLVHRKGCSSKTLFIALLSSSVCLGFI